MPRKKPKQPRKAASAPAPTAPLEAARAKLKDLEALKKKLKAAIGESGVRKKQPPRFSGSWGCGKPGEAGK